MLDVIFTDGELIIDGEISPEELKILMDLKPIFEYQGDTYVSTNLNYDMASGVFTVWLKKDGDSRCVSSE